MTKKIVLTIVKTKDKICSMKRKPSITFSYHEYRSNKSEIRNRLPHAAVYVYKFKGKAIYVGASNDWASRAPRVYTNPNVGSPFLNLLISFIGKRNIIIEIYESKNKDLSVLEEYLFKKLNPISQAFTIYKKHIPEYMCGN